MNSRPRTPDHPNPVNAAYSARAHEYINLLGHISSTAPEDRDLVDRWARRCSGRVVDIGCGPGHWTAYLAEAGINAMGIDPVEQFIDHAQRTYPTVQFRRGSIDDLTNLAAPLAGLFSWYSLIHLDPKEVPTALTTMYQSMGLFRVECGVRRRGLR